MDHDIRAAWLNPSPTPSNGRWPGDRGHAHLEEERTLIDDACDSSRTAALPPRCGGYAEALRTWLTLPRRVWFRRVCGLSVTLALWGVSAAPTYAGPLDWGYPVPLDTTSHVEGVSCTAGGWCAAVTNDGRIATTQNAFAEAPWSARTVAPFEAFDSISCTPLRDLCAASTSDGKVATAVPTPEGLATAWSMADIDGTHVIRSISCPTAGFCAAADLEGNILSSTQPAAGASAWQVTATDSSREITAISCPSQASCVAVDNAGNVLWSTNPSSAPGTWRHEHVSQGLSGVSCSSPAFCVAVNVDGEVLVARQDSTGGYAWQSTGVIDPGRELTGISCVDDALCVVVDSSGGTLESTNPVAGARSWVTTQLQPFGIDSYLFGVSCGSSTFCVAAGEHRILLGESRANIIPPILGRRETVTVVAGTVTVRVRGTRRFEPLPQSSTIPDGSEVDTTHGRVDVEAAAPGAPSSAELYGGRFRIHQEHTGTTETHFALTLPLSGCSNVALRSGMAGTARRHGPRTRQLWVSEHGGSWGTNGRYVSTTVEGTRWLTRDECNRSTVAVAAGAVTVDDLVRNKTKTLTVGQHYVARRGSTR